MLFHVARACLGPSGEYRHSTWYAVPVLWTNHHVSTARHRTQYWYQNSPRETEPMSAAGGLESRVSSLDEAEQIDEADEEVAALGRIFRERHEGQSAEPFEPSRSDPHRNRCRGNPPPTGSPRAPPCRLARESSQRARKTGHWVRSKLQLPGKRRLPRCVGLDGRAGGGWGYPGGGRGG